MSCDQIWRDLPITILLSLSLNGTKCNKEKLADFFHKISVFIKCWYPLYIDLDKWVVVVVVGGVVVFVGGGGGAAAAAVADVAAAVVVVAQLLLLRSRAAFGWGEIFIRWTWGKLLLNVWKSNEYFMIITVLNSRILLYTKGDYLSIIKGVKIVHMTQTTDQYPERENRVITYANLQMYMMKLQY